MKNLAQFLEFTKHLLLAQLTNQPPMASKWLWNTENLMIVALREGTTYHKNINYLSGRSLIISLRVHFTILTFMTKDTVLMINLK